VKRRYSDLLISCDIDEKELKLWVVNDIHETFGLSYTLELFDFQGRRPYVYQGETTMGANESKLCSTISLQECLKSQDPRNVVAVATLTRDREVVSRNHYLLALPKDLRLHIPSYSSEITSSGGEIQITISTNTFAMGVYLEFEGLHGNFSDNFFDLLPGERKVVTFPSEEVQHELPRLMIKSLRDTYL